MKRLSRRTKILGNLVGDRRKAAVCAIGLWAAIVVAGAASSDPAVYYTDDVLGDDPGAVTQTFPIGSSETLPLWLNAGATPTSNHGGMANYICNRDPTGVPPIPGGNGDETCGFHVKVNASGDLSMTSFSANTSLGEFRHLIKPGGKILEIVVSSIANPLAIGPNLIGTLDVSTAGPIGGAISVVRLETVDADLELKHGVLRDLAYVPEPSLQTVVGPCLLLLTWLSMRQRKPCVSRSA